MSKNSQILQDYFDLCELCGDDFAIVAELIHFHHSKEEKVSRILSDITEYIEIDRIKKYAKTFDRILSLPSLYVKVFVEVKRGKIASQVVKIDRSKHLADKPKKEAIEHFVNSLFEGYE